MNNKRELVQCVFHNLGFSRFEYIHNGLVSNEEWIRGNGQYMAFTLVTQVHKGWADLTGTLAM